MRNRIFFILLGIAVAGGLAALIFFKAAGPSKPVGNAKDAKPVQVLLAELKDFKQSGDLLGQKRDYVTLISEFSNHRDVAVWQKALDEVNIKIIFSSVLDPAVLNKNQKSASRSNQEPAENGIAISAVLYEVEPSDTLTKIARKFNTTVELIKRSNNLASDNISPGRRLRIWTGKFSVLVYKSQNILVLKSNDEIVKTYSIATGLNNSTPVGNFKVITKQVNPVWYKAAGVVIPSGSPENILGSRWMGFDLKSYGIHGTTDPSSIGKQATSGCVRMYNRDIEELYALVPLNTEVAIVD